MAFVMIFDCDTTFVPTCEDVTIHYVCHLQFYKKISPKKYKNKNYIGISSPYTLRFSIQIVVVACAISIVYK